MRIRNLRTVLGTAGLDSWRFCWQDASSAQQPDAREAKARLPTRRCGGRDAREWRKRPWASRRKSWPTGIWRGTGWSNCWSSTGSRRQRMRARRGQILAAIFITRAAILEKNNGKWSEVLRCDEHLKNPNGYLGGSPAARGHRLAAGISSRIAKQGLEMKFTPAEKLRPRNGRMKFRANQTVDRAVEHKSETLSVARPVS